MIIFVALLAFALPLMFRNYLEILQGIMAIIWLLLLAKMPETFPVSGYETSMHKVVFVALPLWVFGSFIALSVRRENDVQLLQDLGRMPAKIKIDYETSQAEVDECPVCFEKLKENQWECTNCGYVIGKHD